MMRRERAELDGDFVVFLIGMRINRPLRMRFVAAGGAGDAEDDP